MEPTISNRHELFELPYGPERKVTIRGHRWNRLKFARRRWNWPIDGTCSGLTVALVCSMLIKVAFIFSMLIKPSRRWNISGAHHSLSLFNATSSEAKCFYCTDPMTQWRLKDGYCRQLIVSRVNLVHSMMMHNMYKSYKTQWAFCKGFGWILEFSIRQFFSEQ